MRKLDKSHDKSDKNHPKVANVYMKFLTRSIDVSPGVPRLKSPGFSKKIGVGVPIENPDHVSCTYFILNFHSQRMKICYKAQNTQPTFSMLKILTRCFTFFMIHQLV
jgi:hypothetical protein